MTREMLHPTHRHPTGPVARGFSREPTPDTLPRSHLVQEFAGRNLPVGISARELKQRLMDFAKVLYPQSPEKAYNMLLFSPPMLAKDKQEFQQYLKAVPQPQVIYTINNIFPGLVSRVLAQEEKAVRFVLIQLHKELRTLVDVTAEERIQSATRVMTYLNMLSVAYLDQTYNEANPVKLAAALLKHLNNTEEGKENLARVFTLAADLVDGILGKRLYLTPPRPTSTNDLKEIKEELNLLHSLESLQV
ncbi:MAG: hypothetical protein GXN92_02725 [Candidatus Micrarchaeota archaeon]|nr:hypothetical protein [Candidatus Micrarchaeota archaeon]